MRLIPGAIENMYPKKVDEQGREWIQDFIFAPGNHPDPVGQLVLSAYECAISILQSAGAERCTNVSHFNAYQLDLFMFKDMGLGGKLAKHIRWVHIAGSGEHLVYIFYDDYIAYIKTAEIDAVMAAKTAPPGSQVTIGVLQQFLKRQNRGNETIGDIVEQHDKTDNTKWLNLNDFFRGDNDNFTRVCEVSESSHDIVMGDSISSDVSATDQLMVQTRAEVPVRLLAIEDAKSEEYYKASDKISGALDQLGEQLQQNLEAQQAEWVHSTEEYKDPWMSFEYANKACHASAQVPDSTWMVRSSIINMPVQIRRSRSILVTSFPTWMSMP